MSVTVHFAQRDRPRPRYPMADKSDDAKPIEVEQADGVIVARPKLKMVDDAALKTLGRMVAEASEAHAGTAGLVVLDLSSVMILPSMALGELLQLMNECAARQQKLKLAAVQPQLRRVFAITRLDRVFQFADSVDAARE
jgi:anti-sigma B factor antagonist